jgi:3-hydroxybutyryl-CoA dehydrogenase
MTSDRTAAATVGIVGVVGAGTMGAGIAQLALEAGHEVVLHDIDEAAIERGRSRVRDGLARRAARLDLDEDSTEAWVSGRLARMRDAHSLDAVGAEAEVVVEAALEDLDLKRTIFATLDAAAAPGVILATNTSALSVAAVAQRTRHSERILGLHFFNPAPVMPLVEVVVPPGAAAAVAARAFRLMEAWGKTPVRCADTPGFIVNRVNRPFTIQALRILEAGEATVDDVDEALRGAGFPMGPFELMDLVGLDVNLAASLGVWEPLGRPERLRPSRIQERMVADGHLGRKTGIGF